MKILIINGPNLNLLGTRDTSTYGAGTLEDLNQTLQKQFSSHEITFFQSNEEVGRKVSAIDAHFL